MAGRSRKAERILAGLFGLFTSLGILSKSGAALAQALRLRAALPGNPGGHLEVQEAFITCAVSLTIGLAFGWWGISKFRRPATENQ